MIDTQKAAQIQKMQMADAMAKVKAEMVICENQIQKQVNLMDRNKHEILLAEKKMTDTVEELIRDLREHERTMKTRLQEIYEAQQKHHATRLDDFELVVTQLKSCVERGESISERNISVEILQTNQAIIGLCEELLNTRKPEIYKPSHVHYIVEDKLNISDRIVVSKTDPSMSSAEGQCEKEVKRNTETNFNVVTRDSDGLQCYHKDDQIKVNILTPAGDQLKTEIKDTKNGKYTVTYTPQCAGQHRVGMQVNGQPLTGSPWVVQVLHQYQFAFQFGSTEKGQGEFIQPWAIAVSKKTGTIAVANPENERIQMFSCDGNFLREIVPNNYHPNFVTETGDFLAYFAVGDDDRLSLFTESGQFITHVSHTHLKEPFFLSVGSDSRIITCDMADKKVKVLSPDGKDLLLSFSAPGCDSFPWCAVYHQDKFFVSYVEAHCVKVFNKAGVYLYDIGSEGSGDGQLSKPTGIVIDKFNHLIVCDSGNERLQLFALDGRIFTKMEGQFFDNSGLLTAAAVSNDGHLFVTDYEKNCIYVFH